jgi:hypothetical protein
MARGEKEKIGLMKICYMIVYKIHGTNRLTCEGESAKLLALDNPALTATLTENPEPHFLHIDKSSALATQLLKGLFVPGNGGTLQERLAIEIEEVKSRRAKQTEQGIFLIFDGEAEIPDPDFKSRRDTDEFAVCMDAISKPEIRESFGPSIQGVLTALALSLTPTADRSIEKIGDVIYLIDPDGGKPIYTFSFQGGFGRGSVASPLTADSIAEAAALAPSLLAQSTLARPTSLLIASLDRATSDLQAFIAAWSALEIFVNATFKSAYEARWFAIMADGAPEAAKPVFERFKCVMSDKYRLADKFLIIASVLDPDSASEDDKEFRRLNKLRNDLLHALDTPDAPLPKESIQKLLLKYMKRHLLA